MQRTLQPSEGDVLMSAKTTALPSSINAIHGSIVVAVVTLSVELSMGQRNRFKQSEPHWRYVGAAYCRQHPWWGRLANNEHIEDAQMWIAIHRGRGGNSQSKQWDNGLCFVNFCFSLIILSCECKQTNTHITYIQTTMAFVWPPLRLLPIRGTFRLMTGSAPQENTSEALWFNMVSLCKDESISRTLLCPSVEIKLEVLSPQKTPQ